MFSLDEIFLQRNYADQVGLRLEKFTKQSYSPYKAIFRCPICGDSQKNKHKRRAYILEKNNQLIFHCHNECGSMGFKKFLRIYFNDIYSSYRFDLIKSYGNKRNEDKSSPIAERKPIEIRSGVLSTLTPLNEAPKDIKKYIKDRKIPRIYFNDIYYTDNYYRYINEIIPNKFNDFLSKKENEGRIVFPLRKENGDVFGVIGRGIDGQDPKYITIKFEEDHPKFFGLERLNRNLHSYILEGPIDSFFIKNAIAMAGTDSNPLQIFDDPSKFTMILDNQPRSKSVLKKYEKYIRLGYNIFIWPSNIGSKDINDCVLDGITYQRLMETIKNNTYNGLEAEIIFKQWRRF